MGVAAQALLDSAERGVIEHEDVEALATEWLALTGGDLAIDVIEADDEHVASRVIELCAHVLRVVNAGNVADERRGG